MAILNSTIIAKLERSELFYANLIHKNIQLYQVGSNIYANDSRISYLYYIISGLRYRVDTNIFDDTTINLYKKLQLEIPFDPTITEIDPNYIDITKETPIQNGIVYPIDKNQFIQNQYTAAQTANFWIGGNAKVEGTLQAETDPVNPTDVLRLKDTNIFQSTLPSGLKNQNLFVKEDNINEFILRDEIEVGQFIKTDSELTRAFTRGNSTQADIFNKFKRFAHGGTDTSSGSQVKNNNIPGAPLQTNSWSYNSGTNIISSTLNSGASIGFISNDKYSNYIHTVTLQSTGTDNDRIGIILAFYEDQDDLVLNQAYGLNPADFNWPIDTTTQYIPNQYSLTLVRQREDVNFSYTVYYNYRKLDEKVVANGSNLSGLFNTTSGWLGNSVDVKVARVEDIFTIYTSNYSDAPSGKGSLGFQLTLDLNSDSDLYKFKGKQSYGYEAQSQNDASYSNIDFSGSNNVIYDLRNGDVYKFTSSGYVLDTTRNYFNEIGIRRELYNPYEDNLLYVTNDKTIYTLNNKQDLDGFITDGSNGLTKTGTILELGGNLTHDTSINGPTRTLTLNSLVNITGNTSLNGTLNVANTTTISNGINVTGSSTLGATTFNSTLVSSGSATFNGLLTAGNTAPIIYNFTPNFSGSVSDASVIIKEISSGVLLNYPLSNFALDANVVHKTGDETNILGNKEWKGLQSYTATNRLTTIGATGLAIEKNTSNENYITLHNTVTDEYLLATPSGINIQSSSTFNNLTTNGLSYGSTTNPFTQKTNLVFTPPTGVRTATIQDASGTIAYLTDISSIREQMLGNLYNKSSWSNLSDFTNVSSGASIVSNKIAFSSGTNDFLSQLRISSLGNTVNEKNIKTIRVSIGEKSSTSYGFAIGIQSTYSGASKKNIAAYFDMSTGANSGKISIVGGSATNTYPTIITSTISLSFSVGDIIELTIDRFLNVFTIYARNVTTNSTTISTTYTMTYIGSSSIFQPSMGQHTIYNLGGAFTLNSIIIDSKEIKNANLALFTDSKGRFGTRLLNTNAASLLNNVYNNTIVLSGHGNTTTDMLTIVNELIALKPKYALFSFSSNDIRGSVDFTTYTTQYNNAVIQATNAGIKVLHLRPLYEPSLDQSAMDAYILATYNSNDIIYIDINSNDLADGTHLNEQGHYKLYNTFTSANLININTDLLTSSVVRDQSNTLLIGANGGQTILGGLNNSENLTLTSTFGGTKGKIYLGSAQTTQFDEVNSWLGIKTIPTHSITLASSGNGLAHYNTVDQITNLERGTLGWVGNVYTLNVANLGTGTQRDASIKLNNGRAINIHASPSTAGTFEFAGGTSGVGAVLEVTGTYTAATSRQWFIGAAPTISQTSSAASSIFYAYPFYNTVGSGPDYFLDLGTSTAANLGGTLTPKFRVDRNGLLTLGTWNGVVIDPVYGGTGQSSYTIGDILAANSTTGLIKISDIAVGNVLLSGGVGVLPSYGKVTSTHVDSSIAPIASPTFTGTPTLPTGTIGVTQTAGNNTTALATTAFVSTAIANTIAPTVDIVNTTVVNLVAGTKYYAAHAGLSTGLLPTTVPKGAQILMRGSVSGTGLWKITQNTGQTIHGATNSTTGTAGYIASQAQYDTVALECIVANTDFVIIANRGTLTIA